MAYFEIEDGKLYINGKECDPALLRDEGRRERIRSGGLSAKEVEWFDLIRELAEARITAACGLDWNSVLRSLEGDAQIMGFHVDSSPGRIVIGIKERTPQYWAELQMRRAPREQIGVDLRFMVLERDRFRCRYCGRSPREHPIELHVEHVHPVAKGGTNALENLVAACRDCNFGKRAKILPPELAAEIRHEDA